MKDIKKVEKEIKEELKQTSRKSRKDMDALRQQVRSEAREFKKAAGDVLDTYDVDGKSVTSVSGPKLPILPCSIS